MEIVFEFAMTHDWECYNILEIDGNYIGGNYYNWTKHIFQFLSIGSGEIEYCYNEATYNQYDEQKYDIYFLLESFDCDRKLSVFSNGKLIHKERKYEFGEDGFYIDVLKKLKNIYKLDAKIYIQYEETIKIKKEV